MSRTHPRWRSPITAVRENIPSLLRRSLLVASLLAIVLVLLSGCSSVAHSVLSGPLPTSSHGSWGLSWYKDDAYASGPCVQLTYQTTGRVGSRSVCPTGTVESLFAVWTYDDVGGDVILGYFTTPGDAQLESDHPGRAFVSDPVEALNGARVFCVFLEHPDSELTLTVDGAHSTLSQPRHN